jgi:hypothetical protein
VFGVAAFVLALTATVFMAIGSGSVQPWNYLPDHRTAPQESASESETVEEETAATSVAVNTASTSQEYPETSSTTKAATMTTAV